MVGIAALIWMARAIGVEQVAAMVSSVGSWLIPLFLASTASLLLNSAAIHVFMRPEQRMVGYWRVLTAQLSGQAVSSVTPTGTLGEVVKVTMLVGHAPRYRAVSSIVAYNLCNVIATFVFLLIALALCLLRAELPARVEVVIAVAFAILSVTAAVTVYLLHRGLLRSIAGGAHALRLLSDEQRDKLAKKLAALDEQLKLFRSARARQHLSGYLFLGLARFIGWCDLWIILSAIGHPHGFAFTMIAAAAGMIIRSVAAVIPLGLGADEGGQAGLFELMGAGALVGLTVSLVRRFRTVVMAAVGLLVMLGVQLADRTRYRRARAAAFARQRSSSHNDD